MENKNNNSFVNWNKEMTFEEMMVREIYENFIVCNQSILNKLYPDDGGLYCNSTFDGYTCWDYVKAGTRSYGECPKFMIQQFGHYEGLPFKDCNTDGTWYKHPETGNPWTNYSPCTVTEKVQRAKNVLYVYFCGYGLSSLALIVALLLFTCFRQLKCTRVTIHKNLFLSYILTAVLWISYYATTSFNPWVIENNPVWCRILHVLAQYVTVCNYAWMFCEGFYLHTILVVAFTNEKTLLIICYITGWGLPIIPSIIYSILRSCDSSVNNKCWHEDTYLRWIFTGPIAVSLFINIIFLINIMRILCSKVRSVQQQSSNPLRQSLRATCILIPLLGIQYVALPFRPNAGHEYGKYIYDMTSACLSSFQGLLVSLLFCFLNGEVMSLLKTQIAGVRHRLNKSEFGKTYGYSTVQQVDRSEVTSTESKHNQHDNSQKQLTQL